MKNIFTWDEIEKGLIECVCRMTSSVKNLTEGSLVEWKSKIMEKVDAKIAFLKQVRIHRSNPILKQPDVIKNLEHFHKKFVFIHIDKAANKLAIICKKHYVEVILSYAYGS